MRRLLDIRHNWLGISVGTVFWCLLWGGFSASHILGGLLTAGALFLLFPMPPTGKEFAFRPIAFAWLLIRFVYDVLRSALEVSWYALRPAGAPMNSVIAVQMASRSDLFLTATGMMCTLVPGSIVVEAQRSTGILFLHVIGAETEEQVEQARRTAEQQELRLLRALARRDVLEEAGVA